MTMQSWFSKNGLKRDWAPSYGVGSDEDRRESIFRRIEVRGPDECWPWLGRVNRPSSKKQYGRTQFRGKAWLVHRAVYTLEVGEIPEGMTVDHLCFNESCCNPAHLECVTIEENYARSKPRRRARSDARTHCANGHEFTPENTYRYPNGRKECRLCHRDWTRARRLALKQSC